MVDWDIRTSKEYNTVINISSDITCTNPLIVEIIAYLDWLNKPKIEKNILDHKIKTRWYRTIESTDSTINILGPQIKFKLNKTWAASNKDKKIGAATVVGLGIKNISLVSILNKSATIWNAPLRPINVGPIRLCEKASNLRSVKITNNANKIQIRDINKANSWIVIKLIILQNINKR